jgi:hypothetical protein
MGFKRFPLLIFQKLCAVQRREKVLFNVGEFFPGDGISGDQNNFNRLRQFVLMLPETFAQQSPRAAAFDRAADFFARDDAQFRLRAVGQFVPVRDQAALCEALALPPDAREIAALLKPRGAAQAQAFWRFGWRGHAKSNGCQAFAAHAAAVGERGLATLARIAVEKSVLPFAADLRRLILAFHKLGRARARKNSV